MRRPVGVIISCIILGFAALMLLMMAAGSMLSLALAGHIPVPAQPAQPTADPAMVANIMRATMIVSGLIYALLAAWAIATLVGLVRMRTWARISVMIIGGGLVLSGLVAAVGTVLMQTVMGSAQMPPGQNPAILRMVMIVMGLMCLAIAGIGVWWLIYFALRRTRDAFALAANPQAPPPIGYSPPPSPYAASTYEVASYIPAPDPFAAPELYPAPIQPATPLAAPPSRRPLAISIIGWLLIAGGAVCLPCALLPLPIFLCGIQISGWAAHITMLCFGVISVLAGVGLLRLEKIAFYAAYAFYAFGILNTVLLLLPSVRDRMVDYQTALMQKFSMGGPLVMPFDRHAMGLMMLPGAFFSVIFCGVAIVFLFRSRTAFDTLPT